ncbi:M35 family metallo-endopeptidase [Caballeronia sp. CLC5]|uniref:M35 family metallo-endopeptidase n=1 Tax=Caballeronia sp. CLC5 TaxID=2906764 RepID=UPI001F359377|nr:M35 family metallo-endopeptidase [Caballeronia sp. CLC5]MCE4574116.1 M35 family metallo-endopeptidase [Caballeronia sp. CLC5]
MPQELFEVHSSMTNTIEGSSVIVDANMERICPSMTNAQFRGLMMKLRDIAVTMIDERCALLSQNWRSERERVKTWFGSDDEQVRQVLLSGLPRLKIAMLELTPDKFLRYDDEKARTLSCVPLVDNRNNDASVCKPDSERRIISFYSHFCTTAAAKLDNENKLKKLIHECTHFTDTFDSVDTAYGYGRALQIWGKMNPTKTINNAGSIACYITYAEHVDLGSDMQLCGC